MKGKKFYAILIGLIVIGIGSVQLYRQQQEEKALEFEGYEISKIEKRIDALYNEDKTDIEEDISTEELEDLEAVFEGLTTQKYSGRNKERIENMQRDYRMANDMLMTQKEVDKLFENRRIVKDHISLTDVTRVEEEVATYDDKIVYYERNISYLEDAKEQIEAIEVAKETLESFFDNSNELYETVDREDEEEALTLIGKIKNNKVRQELLVRAERLSLALTANEEALALQEELEAQQALEEELAQIEEAENQAATEETWIPPVETWTPPVNSGTQESGSGNGNTGGTGGSRPTPQPDPEPELDPEPEPDLEPEPELEPEEGISEPTPGEEEPVPDNEQQI